MAASPHRRSIRYRYDDEREYLVATAGRGLRGGPLREASALFGGSPSSLNLRRFLHDPAYTAARPPRPPLKIIELCTPLFERQPHRQARSTDSARTLRGVFRPYGYDEVDRLRVSIRIEHTCFGDAPSGVGSLDTSITSTLWSLDRNQRYRWCGGDAISPVLVASGADATRRARVSDQSLYPFDIVPTVVRRSPGALQRASRSAPDWKGARYGSRRSWPTRGRLRRPPNALSS